MQILDPCKGIIENLLVKDIYLKMILVTAKKDIKRLEIGLKKIGEKKKLT